MIFLAISSALIAGALMLVAGRQQKEEFTQAIREADSKIQDVANDFTTGYFPDNNNFSCTAGPTGAPVINYLGGSSQGTRVGCAFIGKVIQFAPSGTDYEGYKVITVVGRQFEGAPLSNLVKEIRDAQPRPLSGSYIEEGLFGYGMKVKWVRVEGGSPPEVGAIGFFSSFADYDAAGAVSGKQTTQVIALGGTTLNAATSTIESSINGIGPPPGTTTIYENRSITICLESGGTNQHGFINIGDRQRHLATTVAMGSGSCPA